MPTEANKALIRRLYEEAANRGNLNAFDEILASDFTTHEDLPPEMPTGPEGAKQLFAMLRGAFPDLHVTIEDQIAEGDKVAVRTTFAGTQRGDFMGIPPTGRRVRYAVVDFFRIADGRVAEHWGLSDMAGLMQQLSTAAAQQ